MEDNLSLIILAVASGSTDNTSKSGTGNIFLFLIFLNFLNTFYLHKNQKIHILD